MAEQAPDPFRSQIEGVFADIVGGEHSTSEPFPLCHIDEQSFEGMDNRALVAFVRPVKRDEDYKSLPPEGQVNEVLAESVRNKTLSGLLDGIVSYGEQDAQDDVEEVLGAFWTLESFSQYKPL
ncbi:MAG TPA: hypothetical protein VLA92_00115 [Candidatus Saccharimonadales bacterium]|nr:hypothetical protein [Candidatus Saccharimonadales bacterium]